MGVLAPVKGSSGMSIVLCKARQYRPTKFNIVLMRIALPVHKIVVFKLGKALNLANTTVGWVMLIKVLKKCKLRAAGSTGR